MPRMVRKVCNLSGTCGLEESPAAFCCGIVSSFWDMTLDVANEAELLQLRWGDDMVADNGSWMEATI